MKLNSLTAEKREHDKNARGTDFHEFPTVADVHEDLCLCIQFLRWLGDF